MPISRKDKLLIRLGQDWIHRKKLFSTEIAIAYLHGLDKTTAEITGIRSADIRTIIDLEIIILKQEKELYGEEDPTVLSSLDSAIDLLTQDVKGAIATVEIPEDYKKAALTHASKRKRNGIPVDGFHEAINSHITRLDNRIRTVGVPIPEKNILIARKENMKHVKQMYIAMQQTALKNE